MKICFYAILRKHKKYLDGFEFNTMSQGDAEAFMSAVGYYNKDYYFSLDKPENLYMYSTITCKLTKHGRKFTVI